MGSEYGLLVLLNIQVLGMSYDAHGIFYNPVNFAFNLPNYVTSYVHYSGEKIIIIRLRKICFQGIRTWTLESVRTKALLSTSIFSKKSIFNAALCQFKTEPTQTFPLVTPKYLYHAGFEVVVYIYETT